MKKLTVLLCALALLCGFCLPVFADSTVKITTTVPSTHTITVAQADGAAVTCNGQPGTTFTVERLSQPQLLVRPDSGRVLTRVLVNGADVTASVQDGSYTLPAVYEDLTLQVETAAAPQTATPTPQATTPPGRPPRPRRRPPRPHSVFRKPAMPPGPHFCWCWRCAPPCCLCCCGAKKTKNNSVAFTIRRTK